MSDETRICKTCGDEKPITAFYRQGGVNNRENRHYHCSQCMNKKTVERRKSNPAQAEKHKQAVVAWKKSHVEEVNAMNRRANKKWKANNRQKNAERRKKYKRKIKRQLLDPYVANRIGLKVKDVPPQLMEAARHVLKANRILWKLQQTTPTKNASEPENHSCFDGKSMGYECGKSGFLGFS